jgi:uncharacterized protein
LKALEDSKSVGLRAGWQSLHLMAHENGTLVAAAPAYVKSHSQGEYVFDHGWADAFARAGGEYYPKLQVAVPFTPVTGPRLLTAPGKDANRNRSLLLSAMQGVLDQYGLSSAHITFATEDEWRLCGTAGLLQRVDRQFHWRNAGYESFGDFLGSLNAEKRKTLRRERARALEPGITIDWITGSDLTESHWDAFYAFYMDTGSRKWGRPYLTRAFFSLIGERMRDEVLLILAKRNGRYVAGALNFLGSHRIYGRNWGAIEHHPFLHFEVCYYQAIDYAIAKRLEVVEAGAQGEHKLIRGYAPVPTWSVHMIADPRLRQAVASYLLREREAVAAETEALAGHTPFRKGERTDQDAG